MLLVFLYVDKPVSMLEFELDTPASPAQLKMSAGVDKMITANRLPNGKLKVIVYGLNQSVFQGRFASVDNDISGVSNVVGTDPSAARVDCKVLMLSQPKNLNAVIKK